MVSPPEFLLSVGAIVFVKPRLRGRKHRGEVGDRMIEVGFAIAIVLAPLCVEKPYPALKPGQIRLVATTGERTNRVFVGRDLGVEPLALRSARSGADRERHAGSA